MAEPAAKYYELFCDLSAPSERWYLNGPWGVDGRLLDDAFTTGRKYEGPAPVMVAIETRGGALELTMTEELVPILNDRVAAIFSAHIGKDAQLIQARVKGFDTSVWAVNVLSIVDCIDDVKCKEVTRWTAADGNPSKIGTYRKIEGLQIDPAKTGGHAIFRPHGWDVSVIVNEALANALKTAGVRCQLTLVS
jgi:hypothetical protein